MREIEIKATVADEAGFRQRLTDLNIELSEPLRQNDIMFSVIGWREQTTPRHWVRIRDEGNRILLTFKQKSPAANGGMHDNVEHEMQISDAAVAEAMLLAMGYEKVLTLSKERRTAKWDGMELCFDHVEGLGTFMELEKVFAGGDAIPEALVDTLWSYAKRLGVPRTAEVDRGYHRLMLEKMGRGY